MADGQLSAHPDKYKIAYLDDSEPEQFGVAIGKGNTALQTSINEAIAQLEDEDFSKKSLNTGSAPNHIVDEKEF